MRALKAGSLYFLAVFAVAFVLGAIRVTIIAPRLGAVAAVLIELPLILAVSWVASGWIQRRWQIGAEGSADIAMGLTAFALLMVAEATLSVVLTGSPPGDFFRRMANPDGAIGLAGQIGFAALPAIRSRLGFR